MRKISLVFILGVFVMFATAQNVLIIEGERITLEEFKSIFYKNNEDIEITKDYLDEYINLFVNFKLKVKEAEELGLDTNLSFITELEGYRKQLAKPYLRNKPGDFSSVSITFLISSTSRPGGFSQNTWIPLDSPAIVTSAAILFVRQTNNISISCLASICL